MCSTAFELKEHTYIHHTQSQHRYDTERKLWPYAVVPLHFHRKTLPPLWPVFLVTESDLNVTGWQLWCHREQEDFPKRWVRGESLTCKSSGVCSHDMPVGTQSCLLVCLNYGLRWMMTLFLVFPAAQVVVSVYKTTKKKFLSHLSVRIEFFTFM